MLIYACLLYINAWCEACIMSVACSFHHACNMRYYAVTLSLHVHGVIAWIGCECMNKMGIQRVVQ